MEKKELSYEEKAQKKAEKRRERELADIRFILRSPEGRRFYWRLLGLFRVFLRSYEGNSDVTLFNEGRRSAGLDMLNDLLDAKPSAFSEMQNEYASERKREEQEEESEKKDKTDDPLSQ